ncbi:GDSL esterase/lipase At1g29670-like [Rutidosis leptorrhynchoides]|uniref:GDSL esterase/lipase At1g29670-like n=1 Tax=Rutidosis leptorrhynchoides TaxID=125765 RepID=UPI003A99A46A
MKNILLLLCLLSLCHTNFAENNIPDGGGMMRKIKGMFVFGSSLVDNGNNNFLANLAKADYLPYGVDFPLGPSGRFTNGKNVPDLLGKLLNLPDYLPVFANPSTKGNVILNGVNYASGGSGILDDTGSLAGDVYSLSEQLRNFEEVTLPDLEAQVNLSSEELLQKYLFVIGSGGNDYTLNYFLNRQQNVNVTLEDFTANLTISLSSQIKKLYSLGARKFVLMSLNPLGCSPSVLTGPQRSCVPELNTAAELFNSYLKSLVDNLRPQMPGAKLVFVNQYKIIMDIIKHPLSKGFNDTSNACCKVKSREEGGTGVLCERRGSVCADRRRHVFFDGLHPTEAVNVFIARKAFASILMSEVYPYNVYQLTKL